jgi:predicted ArsR family transcriptional regulator
MPSHPLTQADPPDNAALGASRARVLEVLQAAPEPMAVDEVAKEVGLHPNTTRFHLDALVAGGLAERASETRAQPGRPRALYSAATDSPRAGRRSYRLLAEILTSYVANRTKQPAQAALEAGEAWGHFLAERPAPFRRVDADAATQQLTETLEEIGFEPEAITEGRTREIHLHHCPFRETAEEHREVVCAIHLGLMRGVLDEINAPVDAERLDPFVRPTLCIARLGPRPRSRKR